MDAELKPCPFCGGAAETWPWHGPRPGSTAVGCQNDGCDLNPWMAKFGRKKAIAAWNTRALTQAQPGWRVVPVEPTAEIIAGAAAAIWPTASAADIELARKAAPIVLMSYDLSADYTVDDLAAVLATMAPAYRAMLAAAPAPQQGDYTFTDPRLSHGEKPIPTHPQEGETDGRG